MGLLDIYKYEIYRNYANFQGRTKRTAFWWFTLSFYLLLFGPFVASALVFSQGQEVSDILKTVLALWLFGLVLGMMIPCTPSRSDACTTLDCLAGGSC
ncbi:MAG: DUF805 domain-containing protein [Acidithiobacillus sp.]